jgi:hypothetical protein
MTMSLLMVTTELEGCTEGLDDFTNNIACIACLHDPACEF